GHVFLRLVRAGPEVRSGDEIGCAEQDIFLGRLRDEYIEARRGDLPIFQGGAQGCLIDEAATRGIDDDDAFPGLRDSLSGEDVARLVGQRRMQRDDIRACKEIVEFYFLNPEL